jgi:hypothetical protein
MHAMKEAQFDRAVTVKTTPKAQKALGQAVTTAKAAEAVRWRGRVATKEAVVNASWLFLADLPEADLERLMAAYIPYLEALMRGEVPASPGLRLAPAPGEPDRAEAPDPPPGGPIIAAVKQANPAAEKADPRPTPRRRRKNG